MASFLCRAVAGAKQFRLERIVMPLPRAPVELPGDEKQFSVASLLHQKGDGALAPIVEGCEAKYGEQQQIEPATNRSSSEL